LGAGRKTHVMLLLHLLLLLQRAEGLCNERLKCGIRPGTEHGAAVCGSEFLGS
jgi:hypothetical protein